MILIIDNYDSFTYNLLRYFKILKEEVKDVKNDEITIDQLRKMNPEAIVVSPGPGRPREAKLSWQVFEELAGEYPIFGVCLGHQIYAEVSGGKIIKGQRPMHGKISEISHDGAGVFTGLKQGLKVARYHSLVVEEASLPDQLYVSARSLDDQAIMGLRDPEKKIETVQFHPESIATEDGLPLIENYLRFIRDDL